MNDQQIKKLFSYLLLTFTFVFFGCATQSLSPPDSPSLKSYSISFTPIEFPVLAPFEEELNARKTFNIFRAWNGGKYGSEKYGLYWGGAVLKKTGKFALRETYWNYFYVDKNHSGYPGIEEFVREGVNWKHAGEYGKTYATDYANPKFHKYFADLVEKRNYGADGIILDWWHDSHSVNTKDTVSKARIGLAQSLREKMGDDFVLVGNVNWRKDTATIQYLNGVFLELYKTPYKRKTAYTPSEIDQMVDLLEYYETKLQHPKLIAFEPWRVSKGTSNDEKILEEDRLTPENKRLAKLFATILNVHTTNGYYLYADNNHDTEIGDHAHSWYSFYDLDIGKPTSKGIQVAKRVGIRQYEGGLLGYNYTSSDVEVQTPNGTLTLPAFAGGICKFSNKQTCLSL